jgi:hypothetical protein
MFNVMDKYIYIDEHSLSKEICDKIISIYHEDDDNKRLGLTQQGYDTKYKHSMDFDLRAAYKSKGIVKLLCNELNEAMNQYKIQIDRNDKKGILYNHFKGKILKTTAFQLQHYTKNEGMFVYHSDNQINTSTNEERKLVYMWYINDVEVGGETDFIDFKIKPTTGKLVLFPATWTYPHCANVPISNDKYIITGWFVNDIKTNRYEL